jgi:hypothetical protein
LREAFGSGQRPRCIARCALRGFRSAESATALLLALAAVSYLFVYVRTYSQYPSDDAFIHLRIARNFVLHGTPYYNAGEAVGGSSSPLWTVAIAALFRYFGERVAPVAPLEFLLTAGVFGMCIWVLRERLSPIGAVSAAFLIVAMYLASVAAGSMETPAALLCLLASLIPLRKGHRVRFGFLSALAVLLRYELAAWLMIGFLLNRGLKAKAQHIAGAVTPLLLGAAFNVYYFGALIPNTVWAKSRVYRLSMDDFLTAMGTNPVGLVLFVAVNALVFGAAVRRGSATWVRAMAIFPVVLFGLYCAARAFIFPWYWPLMLVPLALSALLVFPARVPYLPLLLLVALPSYPIATAKEAYGLLAGNPTFFREFIAAARVRQYLRIGEDLERLMPTAVLMSSEIGALGWTFPGRVVDAAGLVSPECLKYHPLRVPEERSRGTLGAIPPRAVRDLAPDVVVSMETFSEAFRRQIAAGAITDYVLFRTYPVIGDADFARSGVHAVWGSRSTQVYLRRSSYRCLDSVCEHPLR